jgi:ABC-type lipoprotein export system ATPase subunit
VTHDPEVGDACDRVVRMRDGHVQDHGARAVPVPPLAGLAPEPMISAA